MLFYIEEDQIAADCQYDVPSRSLYKKPQAKVRPVRVRSTEDVGGSIKVRERELPH